MCCFNKILSTTLVDFKFNLPAERARLKCIKMCSPFPHTKLIWRPTEMLVLIILSQVEDLRDWTNNRDISGIIFHLRPIFGENKLTAIEMKSGSETVKGLRPSTVAGIRSTTQVTSSHIPQGQTSNVRIRTTPLTTSALAITKHATVEPSTSIYQGSSIANHWNNGRNSFTEVISTPETKGTVNSLFYSSKPTATSALVIPCSSSIYQPASQQESPAWHRQGIVLCTFWSWILF